MSRGKSGRWSFTWPLAWPGRASRRCWRRGRRCRSRADSGSGPARPIAAVWSLNEPSPRLWKKVRRLAVEVGDGQVGQAVAVEVAAGRCPSRPGSRRRRCRRRPLEHAGLLELHAAQVVPEVVGRRVVGDEEVDQAVAVEVGGDDPQPAPVRVDDAGLGRHVDEPAAVVAEQMVGPGRERPGRAVVVDVAGIDRLARLGRIACREADARRPRPGNGRRRGRGRRRCRGRRRPPRSASRGRRPGQPAR